MIFETKIFTAQENKQDENWYDTKGMEYGK